MEQLIPEQILAKEKDEERRRWRSFGLGQELCDAVSAKDYENARKILFQALEWGCGETVVNWIDENENTWSGHFPLYVAAARNDVRMVKLLLSFPDIDPQNGHGKGEPVRQACQTRRVDILKVLLRDPRISADGQDSWGESPLRRSCWEVEVVRWLIASRKPLMGHENDMLHALGDAKKQAESWKSRPDIPKAVEFLQSYYHDPVATTKRVRAELGVDVSDAAELYALVVLLCDGYLSLPTTITESPAGRFFTMVSKLPMELQMMTCHRAFDSARDLVKRQDSEIAFKRLTEVLALEDGWRAPSYDQDKDCVDPMHTFRGGYKIKRND